MLLNDEYGMLFSRTVTICKKSQVPIVRAYVFVICNIHTVAIMCTAYIQFEAPATIR